MVAVAYTPLLSFRVPGNPPAITHQAGSKTAVRFGHAMHYKTRPYQRQEKNIVAVTLANLPKDWRPIEGPVALRIKIVAAYRKGEKRRIVKAGIEIPRGTKPDLENWEKGWIDCFTMAGLWVNDAQIAVKETSKWWGPMPYWEVSVWRLAPEIAASGPRFAQVAPDGQDRTGTRGRNTRENKTFYQTSMEFGREIGLPDEQAKHLAEVTDKLAKSLREEFK